MVGIMPAPHHVLACRDNGLTCSTGLNDPNPHMEIILV
jgi:hypothetical protein